VSPVSAPDPAEVRLFPSAAAFRAWLEAHHASASHLWVGYYRKHVGKEGMTYVEAVEEALCFGWIDGITYRLDDKRTATRFTPRRRTSVWSATNLDRVARLRAAGRMRPAGIRAFEERDRRKDQVYASEQPVVELPEEWLERFRADEAAWSYWEAQPPSYRRIAASWVTDAKRAETRERRFATLLAESAAGRRPRPFLVERAAREPA
jgi:uncharacterized protein YdeI (YjbR/CyaY-like superfamily)